MFFNTHTHFEDHENIVIFNESIDNHKIAPFFSIGIHPWKASLNEENFLKVLEKGNLENCLAIGEIGLDRIKEPKLDLQVNCFRAQLIIAESLKLPVIFHCVKSWKEIKDIYQEKKRKQKWIFHGFNKVNIIEDVLKTGIMISIGTSVLGNVKLQEAIDLIPNHQLLLETDDSNVNIFEIYQKISEIKKISLPKLQEIISANFKNTFTKWSIG